MPNKVGYIDITATGVITSTITTAKTFWLKGYNDGTEPNKTWKTLSDSNSRSYIRFKKIG